MPFLAEQSSANSKKEIKHRKIKQNKSKAPQQTFDFLIILC